MRIALATVGTTGDVRPFALLARRLVERGHEVTAVTWPVHRTTLTEPGVRVEVAGPHADGARIAAVAEEAATRGPMEQVTILRDFHLADGEEHYRRLRELLPGHDLVVLHGIHGLAHAAVLDLGLRWATAVFDPVLLPTRTAPPPGMPSIGPANPALWWMLDRMLARANGPFDELLVRAGSRQRGLPLFRARSPRLHLVGCSPRLIAVPDDLPAGTSVTGTWVDRTPAGLLAPPLAAFVADGSPPVAITFGSMRAATPDPTLDDAIGRVLAAGRRIVLHGATSVTSPSLLAIGGLVDHRALFARAAAVVHHGGAGTTHTAALAGVPQVVVPHVGDQRYWAGRLARLGVAPDPIPARDLDPARLAASILGTVADPARAAAAAALAGAMAGEDGIGLAIGSLEHATVDPA
jgi:sterol 3beta-glucosyltransferase